MCNGIRDVNITCYIIVLVCWNISVKTNIGVNGECIPTSNAVKCDVCEGGGGGALEGCKVEYICRLTYNGRLTHICVNETIFIGPDNSLSYGPRQAIIWTNVWNIVNCTPRNRRQWNINQNSYILLKKMHLKMSSAKWRQICLGLKVLTRTHCGLATRSLVLVLDRLLSSKPLPAPMLAHWKLNP